jgi:hypothetical protein
MASRKTIFTVKIKYRQTKAHTDAYRSTATFCAATGKSRRERVSRPPTVSVARICARTKCTCASATMGSDHCRPPPAAGAREATECAGFDGCCRYCYYCCCYYCCCYYCDDNHPACEPTATMPATRERTPRARRPRRPCAVDIMLKGNARAEDTVQGRFNIQMNAPSHSREIAMQRKSSTT